MAQNEMRAMRGMPQCVRLNEGLGRAHDGIGGSPYQRKSQEESWKGDDPRDGPSSKPNGNEVWRQPDASERTDQRNDEGHEHR